MEKSEAHNILWGMREQHRKRIKALTAYKIKSGLSRNFQEVLENQITEEAALTVALEAINGEPK